jgi:hypothetical protein
MSAADLFLSCADIFLFTTFAGSGSGNVHPDDSIDPSLVTLSLAVDEAPQLNCYG